MMNWLEYIGFQFCWLMLVYHLAYVFFYQWLKVVSKIDILWGSIPLWLLVGHALAGKTFSWDGWDVLIILWSLRLTLFLAYRNGRMGEDRRYLQMMRSWQQPIGLQVYLKIFLLQGLLAFIVFLPVLAHLFLDLSDQHTMTIRYPLWWLCALAFWWIEAQSDWQKWRFKQQPSTAGLPCQIGWWRDARYINYFAELAFWWTVSLPLISRGWSSEQLAWLGPITLTFFMLKVTGIAPLEQQRQGQPLYEQWKREVPAQLLPWRAWWYWILVLMLIIGG